MPLWAVIVKVEPRNLTLFSSVNKMGLCWHLDVVGFKLDVGSIITVEPVIGLNILEHIILYYNGSPDDPPV